MCETAPTLTSLSFKTPPMSFVFKNCTKIMCNSMGFAKRKPYLTLAKSRAISLGLGFAFRKTHVELHMILGQFLKIKLMGRVSKLSEVRVGAISHNLGQKGVSSHCGSFRVRVRARIRVKIRVALMREEKRWNLGCGG